MVGRVREAEYGKQMSHFFCFAEEVHHRPRRDVGTDHDE